MENRQALEVSPSEHGIATQPNTQKAHSRKQCTCVDSTGDRCIRFRDAKNHPYCAYCLNRECEEHTGLGHPSVENIARMAESATLRLAEGIGGMRRMLFELGLRKESSEALAELDELLERVPDAF